MGGHWTGMREHTIRYMDVFRSIREQMWSHNLTRRLDFGQSMQMAGDKRVFQSCQLLNVHSARTE